MQGAPSIYGMPATPSGGQQPWQSQRGPMPQSPPGMTPPSTFNMLPQQSLQPPTRVSGMPAQAPPQPWGQQPQQHSGMPAQNPQQPQQPGQMHPQLQQLMKNPQFMQMLMQHMQSMRGGQAQPGQGLGGLSAMPQQSTMQPQLGGGMV